MGNRGTISNIQVSICAFPLFCSFSFFHLQANERSGSLTHGRHTVRIKKICNLVAYTFNEQALKRLEPDTVSRLNRRCKS